MATTKPISAEAQNAPASVAGDFSSNLGRALFQQRIETVLLTTKAATGADGLAISLREGDVYVCRASVGIAPEIGVTVESGQGICGRCIAEEKAIVEQELDGDIKSVASVPVMREGRTFGFVAGFSVKPHAFPPSAIADFVRLSDVITNQIEPFVAIDLRPQEEEEEEQLLSQLGIVPEAKGVANGTEADESFLTDLVRDVLESAPSNQAVIAPISAPPEEELALEDILPEETPKFPSRTTEEVLMEVVDHSPKVKPSGSTASTAAAAAPAPVQGPVSHPQDSTTTSPSTSIASRKTESEAPVVPFTQEATEPEPWTRMRIGMILAVLLLAITGTSWYFIRHNSKAVSQASTPSTTAAQKAPETGQPATQPSSQPATPPVESKAKAPDQKNAAHTTAPRSQSQPLLIASSSNPARKIAGEDAPPTLNGVPVKFSAPELPTTTGNVVFSGKRSTGATPPKLTHRVEPTYPTIARTMRLSGDVRLEVTVGTNGRVKAVRALDGPQILVASAESAVHGWRYQPAMQNGQAVESVVEVMFHFR